MSGERSTTKRLPKRKFTLLLASLVFLLIVAPLWESTRLGGALFTSGITAVFVTGIVANRRQKWIFRSGLIVAAVAIPICWAAMFARSHTLDFTEYIIITVFCGVTAAMILIAVMRDYLATAQAVVGAICVYLLIGLTFAMLYSTIEYVQDEPFDFPLHRRTSVVGVEHTAFSQMIYFSFVSMSTLGYGDISPRTALAETACWMQAVVGQLYIAILIARLVTAMPIRRPDPGS